MAPKRESRRGRVANETSRAGRGDLEKTEVVESRRILRGRAADDEPKKPNTTSPTVKSSSPTPLKPLRNVDSKKSANENTTLVSSVAFNVAYGKSLPGNECRLHPAGFRKLRVQPGAILCVELSADSKQRLYVEAFISSTVSSGSIEISGDLSHFFDHSTPTVAVSPLHQARQVPSVQSLMVSVLLLNTSKSDERVEEASSLQWKALLRRNLLHRLCYKGMRTTIQTALCTLLIDVEDLTVYVDYASEQGKEEVNKGARDHAFGILSPASDIQIISPREEAEMAEPTTPVSRSTGCCIHDAVPSNTLYSSGFHHLLVVGDEGTGKTFVLHEEMERHRRAGRSVIEVAVQSIAKASDSEISSRVALQDWFDTASRAAPSTLVFDDLHLICSSSASGVVGSTWAMNLFARGFIEALQRLRSMNQDVCVLASAVSCDRLHALLSHPSALGTVIQHLEIPATVEEKIRCMERAVLDVTGFTVSTQVESTKDQSAASLSRDDLCRVAEATNGFSQRDYRSLVELAAARSFQTRCSLECTAAELMECSRRIQPSALKQFDISIPDVTWNDIGGSEAAKQVLQDVVGWALGKQKDIFEEFHLTPPRGVLLYGPPGCSKTMLAKALANESHLNFISVKGPEVFSKWVGDSEKAVRNIFTRARAASPCVVFIDELDGMCGHRGQGGVSDRVISQFLTELDGLPTAMSEKEHALIFVAATNRPDNIDGAVLRPGRIDRLVHVGLPSYEERRAIAVIQFRKIPVSDELTPEFIASNTEGYSGAEVVAVIKEAAFHALSACINCENVTVDDVLASLKKVRPRTKQEDVDWYLKWGQTKIAPK